MDDPKTIIGFKIKGTKKNKELFWGVCMLVVFLVGIALFGLIQVEFCQDKQPKKSWEDCIVKNRFGR